jgi:hypothetical protein
MGKRAVVEKKTTKAVTMHRKPDVQLRTSATAKDIDIYLAPATE